jgi:LCP family protein required for cell wall assembly
MRRWPRRLLVTTNVVVALSLVGAASAWGYVTWRFNQIKTESVPSLQKDGTGGKPFTLLVVGSDSRSALKGSNNAQFGTAAQAAGQRSDTIILVRVVPNSRQLSILSIPRDLWVPIPGHGNNRINSAFDTGADLLVQTIQADLGIPVNHYVEVNFDTFRQVSNAVGGVSFYFPTPAKDNYSLLNVPNAGCVSLQGDQALAFVRARHYEYYQNGYWHFEAQSDLARIKRQQAFIKKMIKKAAGEYTNPFALNSIIGGITNNLTLDSGFSHSLLLSLAKNFRTIDAAGIPSQTLPTYPYTVGGADVLGLQQPQAQAMIAAFNAFGNAPAPTTTSSTAAPAAGSGSTTAGGTTVGGTTVGGTTVGGTTATTTVSPSSVSIEVVNGSGVTGQATKVAADLTGLAYKATVNSTLRGSGFTTTEIKYAPDALAAAKQLQSQLVGGATLVESTALTPTAYGLEVVTGSSYAGVTASGSGGSGGAASTASTAPVTSAAGTTTPTTAPANTAAVAPYVLPGMPAGQVPPNC